MTNDGPELDWRKKFIALLPKNRKKQSFPIPIHDSEKASTIYIFWPRCCSQFTTAYNSREVGAALALALVSLCLSWFWTRKTWHHASRTQQRRYPSRRLVQRLLQEEVAPHKDKMRSPIKTPTVTLSSEQELLKLLSIWIGGIGHALKRRSSFCSTDLPTDSEQSCTTVSTSVVIWLLDIALTRVSSKRYCFHQIIHWLWNRQGIIQPQFVSETLYHHQSLASFNPKRLVWGIQSTSLYRSIESPHNEKILQQWDRELLHQMLCFVEQDEIQVRERAIPPDVEEFLLLYTPRLVHCLHFSIHDCCPDESLSRKILFRTLPSIGQCSRSLRTSLEVWLENFAVCHPSMQSIANSVELISLMVTAVLTRISDPSGTDHQDYTSPSLDLLDKAKSISLLIQFLNSVHDIPHKNWWKEVKIHGIQFIELSVAHLTTDISQTLYYFGHTFMAYKNREKALECFELSKSMEWKRILIFLDEQERNYSSFKQCRLALGQGAGFLLLFERLRHECNVILEVLALYCRYFRPVVHDDGTDEGNRW